MIRTFKEKDIPEVMIVERLTQLSPWSEDIFKQCFQGGCKGWIVQLNNQLIGFILVSFNIGECHILNVGIHPDFQKQGFGRQLLLYALKEAKQNDVSIAYLEVRKSNKKAIELYQKIGFVEIGVRNQYYPAKDGKEDALIFAKDLGVDEEL